ncbi:MAG TPA: DUF6786 family protein [Opitutaceae bacterium]|nr:DUF6786 family protein [Opitutaceae bacterium]
MTLHSTIPAGRIATFCLALILVPLLPATTFRDDTAFLRQHTSVIVLQGQGGRVAVVPAWQGRVMTSSAEGDAGLSFGWINRSLIASGKTVPHMNAFGGEDRFWMGPEGGQFGLFFAPGVPFDYEHWFTPPIFDTLPFQVVHQSTGSVEFTARFSLKNHSGTAFAVAADRKITLLDPAAAWKDLGVAASPGVNVVAFETSNRITNAGAAAWTKQTGLLSIWILGMFQPTPATTIVVPIKPGDASELGPKVTSNYFGAVPPARLAVRDNALLFAADGRFRSKIGVNPRRSRGVLGSYDAEHHVLTIVQFNQPDGVTDYVNSLWQVQERPFGGDVENSYNDGPPTPGAKPMGPFYELETSSPAAALAPGQSMTHLHRTIHLRGPMLKLDAIARATLGVSLQEITSAVHPE